MYNRSKTPYLQSRHKRDGEGGRKRKRERETGTGRGRARERGGGRGRGRERQRCVAEQTKRGAELGSISRSGRSTHPIVAMDLHGHGIA